MLPTSFLIVLLHLQMLLSPAWVSTFFYGLKFLLELQAGQRISYVLVSSTGPMSVDKRDRVGGGAISPSTRSKDVLISLHIMSTCGLGKAPCTTFSGRFSSEPAGG